MKKKVNILFISPNKWGRGITPIWIASHSGILKRAGHNVKLFDCTFYKNWSDDELNLNTKNSQFKSSEYENKIVFKFGMKSPFYSLNKFEIYVEKVLFIMSGNYQTVMDATDKVLKLENEL